MPLWTRLRTWLQVFDLILTRVRGDARNDQTGVVRKLNKVIITMVINGRSTTAHLVFELRSLQRGFGESCTIVQGTNVEPENVLY